MNLLKTYRHHRAIRKELRTVDALTKEFELSQPTYIPLKNLIMFSGNLDGKKFVQGGNYQCPKHLHLLGTVRTSFDREILQIDSCRACEEEAYERAAK